MIDGAANEERVSCEVSSALTDGQPYSLKSEVISDSLKRDFRRYSELQIVVVSSGSGRVLTEQKTSDVEVGSIFVLNPDVTYCIVTDSVLKYYLLTVSPGFLMANGIDIDTGYFEENIDDLPVSQAIMRLVAESSSNDGYKDVITKAYVMEIMVLLCRSYLRTEISTAKESKTLPKIKHSISYIKNNFRSDISLEDVSNEAGLSIYHFCREFKKATGYTPVEYINRTRCEYARTLLESRKYSVSEIGEVCGFTTSAHFSRTFKRFLGVYPSDYVKSFKRDVK